MQEVILKFLGTLKQKALMMKIELLTVHYAFLDKRVRLLPKILIGIAILYALSPIDLIPDFIPVLGYLDDLIIIPALISLAIKIISPQILAEARIKAENEPILLKKNWTFGILFICFWFFVLFVIVKAILGFIYSDK